VLFFITYDEICMISYKTIVCVGVSVFGNSVLHKFFRWKHSKSNDILNCNFLSCYMLKIFVVNVYVCVFCNLLIVNCVLSRTMFR